MFQATTTGDLGLEAITRRLTADQKSLGREVAREGRKALIANVRSRRGTLSFSGMNTKLGARTTVKAGAGSSTVYIDPVPAGAWAIVERGRARSAPKRRKALHLGDGDLFAESARETTGTPGLWDGAEPAIQAAIDAVVTKWADEAMEG